MSAFLARQSFHATHLADESFLLRCSKLIDDIKSCPIEVLFKKIDTNNDGTVSLDEITDMFEKRGINEVHFQTLWEDFMKSDFDRNHGLDLQEFKYFLDVFTTKASLKQIVNDTFMDLGLWASIIWSVGVLCIMMSDINKFLATE